MAATTPDPARTPEGKRREKPTIRDVAREAGVSTGTVSGVLNNRATVAEATRRHVLRVINELGFAPNSAAQNLRGRNTPAVGVIVPDLSNPFFAAVTDGIQLGLAPHDVMLTLCSTWSDPAREEHFARILRTERLDGVIYLTGTGFPSTELLKLARAGSVIFVDEVVPGLDAPFIGCDNRLGMRMLTEHLVRLGHRRFGFVGGPVRLWSSEQRLSGFREALAMGGLDPDAAPVVSGDHGQASGQRAAALLVAGTTKPTAIVCANDLMAFGVLQYCREAGLSVPGDLSVTGFDDIPAAELVNPGLTTASQPARDMGRAGAELLLHRIGLLAEPPVKLGFPVTLRVRGSSAPP